MSTHPAAPPAAYLADEKNVPYERTMSVGADGVVHDEEYNTAGGQTRPLQRKLKGRHMQMIAIGGAIGAGYFVGSGSALRSGGPASVVVCFAIVGVMLLMVMQALAELAVLYPVNGAFFDYATRFINKSWGFACGWDYAINWLCVLPFEINAASLTIRFWNDTISGGAWIAIFLVALCAIQIWGVKGYGEVEFVLSIMKITAATGFMLYAIILNCGGVPTAQPPASGYIGGKFWSGGEYPAFRNGFQGFCSVFVTAAFAFGGTEMTGLAAAEAADPLRSVPKAAKQVFWRVSFFYIVGLALLGLVVPANDPKLLGASTSNTAASAFVIALSNAGVKGLPSVMNAVITISVMSVANSCVYGSTRTIQALAIRGMAPGFFKTVDKQGRPVWATVLQLAFGLLAFVGLASKSASGQFFDWLLAFSALIYFFIWGSILACHIRFRSGWKVQGRQLDEIPYQAAFGVAGSWVGLIICGLCIMASFYSAVWPLGDVPSAEGFFQQWLAVPLIIVLYLGYKLYARDWTLFVKAQDMDITTGIRENLNELRDLAQQLRREKTWANLPLRILQGLF